jgi:hypothetical protein
MVTRSQAEAVIVSKQKAIAQRKTTVEDKTRCSELEERV